MNIEDKQFLDKHSYLKDVYSFAEKCHIEHPLAVAKIVASVTDDKHTIAAALLHDTIEDCQSRFYNSIFDVNPIASILFDFKHIFYEHDKKFAKTYMKEKMQLLEVLTKGDYTLLKRAVDIINLYYKKERIVLVD